MKTQLSIWPCRDGGSSAKPKFGKSRAETNENAVFNLAVPGRRFFGEAKVSESRAQRQMKTQLSIWPCRDGGSSAKVRKAGRCGKCKHAPEPNRTATSPSRSPKRPRSPPDSNRQPSPKDNPDRRVLRLSTGCPTARNTCRRFRIGRFFKCLALSGSALSIIL